MKSFELKPFFDVKPWAGDLLSKIFNCLPKTGEAWIVSAIPNKESKINGKNFSEFINQHYVEMGLKKDEQFPVLIKVLDANENLSVQVHPDDEYAIKKGFHNGKYEIWYILDENRSNKVIFGVKKVDRNTLKKAIDDGKLEDYLEYKSIKKHDLLKCTPGTVHAVMAGSFFLEVQDPCDITYRLYDYNRLPRRELHIEDGLNSIYKDHKQVDLNKYQIEDNKYYFNIHVKGYDKFYFKVEKITYKTFLIIK